MNLQSLAGRLFLFSLENNVCSAGGGAIHVYDTRVDLIHNCTFVRNSADDKLLLSGNYINVSLLSFSLIFKFMLR